MSAFASTTAVSVHRFRLAQCLHAKTTLKDNLAAVDEAEANARDAELLHGVLDEVLEQGDAFGVQWPGFLPAEHLALISLRAQAADRQREARDAFLKGRAGRFDDRDGPILAGPPGQRVDHRPLIGRGLIIVDVPLVPAILGRLRRRDSERPVCARTVACPAGSDRGRGIRGSDVDQRQT